MSSRPQANERGLLFWLSVAAAIFAGASTLWVAAARAGTQIRLQDDAVAFVLEALECK